MAQVNIIGVGMTPLGKHLDRTLRDLGGEACRVALKEAGVHPKEIQAGYCGNALGSAVQGETGVGQNAFWEAGISGIPIINVENACATGSSAVHLASQAIAAEAYDLVLVVGVEKAVMPKGTMLNVGAGELETQLGDVFPGYFALIAQQHMQKYGTTREQMALVSVKNHDHGVLNPFAQFQKKFTVQEVLESPMIADPMTLFSCCPNSDGAAALVLASDKAARRLGQDGIRLAASTLTTGTYANKRDLTFWEAEERAARQAYEQAGIGPEDVDVVEVHDAFTICEIVHYEGLGLCPRGEGGRLVEEGVTALGGRIPVNPSGGLLSKGHPVGASGVAQIVELVWHLQGRADKRQVPGAGVALAQIMGGSKEGDVKACTVHIMIRDKG